MLDSGSGWSNPYAAEYEAIINSLETAAIGNFNNINLLTAPETWSAMAIDPLNALCGKLNRDFLDTVAYRIGKLTEARIVNPVLDFRA